MREPKFRVGAGVKFWTANDGWIYGQVVRVEQTETTMRPIYEVDFDGRRIWLAEVELSDGHDELRA